MAYTFRIHKEVPGNTDGWTETTELAGGNDNQSGVNGIPDLIEGGTNSGKIGTSIPTPFARIYLFETAYSFVSANKNHDPNFYDQLVSQSLDLLQLLFEKGKEKKLKLYSWNASSQLRVINQSGFKDGQRILANALNMSVNAKPELQNIIIVEYDGVILGGSSPFTLVYTSPNATRELSAKNIQLFSNDKHPLFQGRIKHLRDRSIEFQKYIDWLIGNNIQDFSKDGTPLKSFYNYFKSQTISLPQEIKDSVRDEYYPVIRKTGNLSQDVIFNVYGSLSLRYNDEPIDMSQSHFLMSPTVNCYGSEGSLIPVVLPTSGDSAYDGWQYTSKETWKSFTTFDYWNIKDTPVNQRYLVMNGANGQLTTNKYPWLTEGDFFEDTLVSLDFDINHDRFFSPLGDDSFPYLLPIKREYFKYFTLEDLKESLRCKISYDQRGKAESASFELDIRLMNKDHITLRRSYVSKRHPDPTEFSIRKFKGGFSFGVFPFYRCTGSLEEDKKNEYSIYLYSLPDEDKKYRPTLSFYKQDFDGKRLCPITDPAGEDGLTRTEDNAIGTSRVISLRNELTNSFDLIEVNVTDSDNVGSGLAIPMWMPTQRPNSNKKSYISVDFGTSNTYVSYIEDGEAKPLSFGIEDQQMVLLNGHTSKDGTSKLQFRNGKSFGRALYMNQFLREFVPSVLGNKNLIDESEYIEFPIKTATLEKQNFTAADQLFSGINIGFNIDNENNEVDPNYFYYQTNLKWNAEEQKGENNLGEFNKAQQRVQAFCDQILWMLKNKLVMQGYATEDMKMIYFYPDSMSPLGRRIFKECWKKSVDTIFINRGFNVEIMEDLEAISPYYSLTVRHGSEVGGKSIANIDVGGGTTDYFILDQRHFSTSEGNGSEQGKAYEASVFFAGNDLWGAKYPESTQPNGINQHNGFVTYMRGKMLDTPIEARKLFEAFGENRTMSDYTSFFFKNNKLFNFSDLVSNHPRFKYVLFMHYASLIYHFAEMLNKIKKQDPDFTYPEVLTFTGKGSEYVNMITDDPGALSQITTDLLKAFEVEGFTSIRVIKMQNPKALTADGGLYKLMSHPSLQVHLFDSDQFGFDSDQFGATKSSKGVNTPFYRIGKSCLGFEMEEGKEYKNKDVRDLEDKVMASVQRFVHLVHTSDKLNKTRQYLRLNLLKDDERQFLEIAKTSYEIYANRSNKINRDNLDSIIGDNLFFYAMKNTLIELSNIYAQQKTSM